MKVNSKHYFLFLMSLMSILITAFGYWYVYNATFSQAKNNNLTLQNIEIDKVNKIKEQELMRISQNTKEERNKLKSYFITEEKILDYIKLLENIAKDSSTEVTLSSINIEDMSDKEIGYIGNVTIDISIIGSWMNINKALTILENLPYATEINSIDLRSIGQIPETKDKKSVKVNKWSLKSNIKVLMIK